jgi:hypothetical protein
MWSAFDGGHEKPTGRHADRPVVRGRHRHALDEVDERREWFVAGGGAVLVDQPLDAVASPSRGRHAW